MTLVRNWPDVSVEVAFTSDANTATTPTWVGLVNRVLAVDFQRSGRTTEQDFFQAGQATITLDNSDGAFNPANNLSPYYPNLLPYRPIRITATWLGIVYPLWAGYVERWPQTFADPAHGYAVIECVDAFSLISQIGLDSALQSEIIQAGATVYYPMDEDSTSATAGNRSAFAYPSGSIYHTKTVNAATPGKYQFGQPLAIAGADKQQGIQFTGTNAASPGTPTEDGYGLILQGVPFDWNGGWQADIWVNIPAAPTQNATIWRAYDPTNPTATLSSVFVRALSTGYLEVTVNCADGIIVVGGSMNKICDGQTHLISVRSYPAGQTLDIWIDGVIQLGSFTEVTDIPSPAVNSTVMIGAALFNPQIIPRANPPVDGEPLTGTVGGFMVLPLNGSLTGVDFHPAGTTVFEHGSSDERATRLLGYGSWQPTMQQTQNGSATMAAATGIAGTSLLQALQDVTDAEQGTLTVTADGKVDFRSRDDRMGRLTPTLTLGSNTASDEIPYLLDGFQLDYDPTLVVNDWQVSRPGGITAETADQTSIAHYFPRQKQLTMNVDTDDQVTDASNWLIGREAEPHMRLEEITVDAGAMDGTVLTGLWPGMLGVDLHARVRVNHQPLGAPSITFDGFVESLHHTIDPSEQGGWKIALRLSPVMADYWTLEDPVQGYIDETYVLAF